MSIITVAQAHAFAAAAGFTGHALDVMVAIAQAESSLNTTARNVNTDSHTFSDGHVGPSTDRGVLQINDFWWPQVTDAMADDPATAFHWGYTISHSGTDFTPWSTYQSGAYLKFMPTTATTPTGDAPVTTLPPGVPRNPAPLSQLHEPTKDGAPDENAPNNCGETAAAWVVRDLGNEPTCDGDELHDEVIGQGVIGGSDLLSGSAVNSRYAAALAKRGVALAVYRGTQAELVAKCHAVMNAPAGDVLINVGGGSNYLHQFSDPAHYSGYGHICVVAHSVNGGLELMDPWIGGYRSYTDAELEQMIVWGYIVIATPLAVATTGGTTGGNTPMWHQVSAGVMADSHGVETRYAMAAYLAAHPDTPDVVPGCGGETYISAETSILPLAGAPGALVYQHSDNAVHTDQAGIVLWEQHQALAAAQAADAQAQSQLAQAQQQASAADAKAQQDAATIGAQSGQIATLTQQAQQQAAQISNLQAQLDAAQSAAKSPAPSPAPTTPADAAALLVTLIYAEAEATLKATSTAPAATAPAASTSSAS